MCGQRIYSSFVNWILNVSIHLSEILQITSILKFLSEKKEFITKMFWVKLLCYHSLKLQKVIWVRERNKVSIGRYIHQYCKTESVICIKQSINLLIN